LLSRWKEKGYASLTRKSRVHGVLSGRLWKHAPKRVGRLLGGKASKGKKGTHCTM